MQKQSDFNRVKEQESEFKRDIMSYNIMKQMQQNEVRKEIENAIQWKQQKKKEDEERNKEWDKEFIQNMYKPRPGTMLDFFYLNKKDRGYECPIMRQKRPNV